MAANFIILTLCGLCGRANGGGRLESVGRGYSSTAELQDCQLVRAIWPKYTRICDKNMGFQSWYPAQAAAAAAAAAPSPRPEMSEEA